MRSQIIHWYKSMHTMGQGSPIGGFSGTFGMSEARGIPKNTDFSIARILAEDRAEHVARADFSSPTVDFQRHRIDQGHEQRDVRRKRRKSEDAGCYLQNCRETNNDKALRREEENAATRASIVTQQRNNDKNRHVQGRTDLTWLQYTRYKPPRLPRRSFVEKRTKRRAGDHPRIPFSSSQL